MLNSAMPKMPGMGSLTDTIEFLKKLWGGGSQQSLGIPGMVMPTLSLEEVDKQIKDLKAVEAWLTVNMNMLRGTIQALEVQSATITALQTMGQNFSAAVSPANKGDAAPNFTFAEQAGAATAAAEMAKAEKAEGRRHAREALKEEFKAAGAVDQAHEAKPHADEGKANDQDAAAPAGNPAHWWNLLQDQFKQAVSTAMTPEALSKMNEMGSAAKSAMESVAKSMTHAASATAKPAPAKKAAAKPATKTAAKKTAAKSTAAKSTARKTTAKAKPAVRKVAR